MTASQKGCYAGRIFRRCQESPVAICQYCGRSFCLQHGDQLQDSQHVCQRRHCQRKVADLKAHNAYMILVSQRNDESACGLAGCNLERWGQCSHCDGVFCDTHLHPRSRTVTHNGRSAREPVSLCDHCWRRMDLWAKV